MNVKLTLTTSKQYRSGCPVTRLERPDEVVVHGRLRHQDMGYLHERARFGLVYHPSLHRAAPGTISGACFIHLSPVPSKFQVRVSLRCEALTLNHHNFFSRSYAIWDKPYVPWDSGTDSGLNKRNCILTRYSLYQTYLMMSRFALLDFVEFVELFGTSTSCEGA